MLREEWLSTAADLIYGTIISPFAVMREGERIAVSCGWPSKGALSASRRRVGECWAAAVSLDKSTRHIFISPVLSELVDGYGDGVLPTLAHELVHVVAATPGHRGEFRRIGKLIGLEGKMASSVAGNELCQKLNAIARQLGPYPHAALDPQAKVRTQSTRMLKCEAVDCTQCSYVVRTTRVWLTEFGPPKCPHGSVMTAEGVDIFGNDTD